MVSLSVGFMLSTTFLHALPEAFAMTKHTCDIFAAVLAGILFFFLLEKCSIIRHSHHHEHDHHDHDHEPGFDKRQAGSTGWMILVGDAFHNFTDGIMIAAAFMADTHLGIITCLAVFAHEIPQEIGDFIVLLNAGFTRKRAYIYNLICSFSAVIGALVSYYTLDKIEGMIPYALAFSSAGFIYIAVSDLIPQMQQRTSLKHSFFQVLLIGAGIAIIYLITHGLHAHAH